MIYTCWVHAKYKCSYEFAISLDMLTIARFRKFESCALVRPRIARFALRFQYGGLAR